MILIKDIPELNEKPLVFSKKKYSKGEAHAILVLTIKKARETINAVKKVKNKKWGRNPSTDLRIVFSYWLTNATLHFNAALALCENEDLSVVLGVHHRQIFEILIQARYFSSQDLNSQIIYAQKMFIIGCLEYLDKLNVLKNNTEIKTGYDEILGTLNKMDKKVVDNINKARESRQFNWFGCTYSKLAEKVSRGNENLKVAYQLISADIHGSWGLSLRSMNPKPGQLDFRSYSSMSKLYLRAADSIYLLINLYANLWNEIANSVGAEQIKFTS